MPNAVKQQERRYLISTSPNLPDIILGTGRPRIMAFLDSECTLYGPIRLVAGSRSYRTLLFK